MSQQVPQVQNIESISTISVDRQMIQKLTQHFILTLPSASISISDILKVTFGFAVPLGRDINSNSHSN